MINADKGELRVSGRGTDIIFELNHILEYFVKEKPEVLGAILTVWGDRLETVLSTGNANTMMMECVKEMTEHYIRLREELNDE